jgi:hypothetical protein
MTPDSGAPELPRDLAEAISDLTGLDDASLWRAARSAPAPEKVALLEELLDKRRSEGLTEAEAQTVAGLLKEYERAMLIRAEAVAILKQRGHDISGLLARPEGFGTVS